MANPESRQVISPEKPISSSLLRFEEPVHAAVRNIVKAKRFMTDEMPHSGKKTLCCGEGGSVGFLSPGLAGKWAMLRKDEAAGKRIVTYCAGCANCLQSITPTSHLLDIIFEPEASLADRSKVSKSPFTYLNRLRLKKKLKKTVNAATTRERTFTVKAPAGMKDNR